MARGGRSIGHRSHGHHHHHHHHSHYGRGSRGAVNPGAVFGVAIDTISNLNMPASVVNGVYTLSGSQINVMARMN